MLSLLRCGKTILIESCLLHKIAEKVTPDVTSKLISVNCITQCVIFGQRGAYHTRGSHTGAGCGRANRNR